MSLRRGAGTVAIAVCVSCGVPVAASALEPGVHIDPGSPAGKEYGIPLWVLRGEASGHPSPQGIPPPPLFGVGIGPARATGSSGAGRRPTHGGGHAGAGTHAGAGSSAGAGAGGSLSAATIEQLTREGSPTSLVALIAAALVALGLAAGAAFALRRRRVRGEH